MKFNFIETKKIEFDIDFQKIYDFIEKEYKNDPNYNYNLDPWDIYTVFGDNLNYYLKKIYEYDVEDNEYNESAMDIIYEEWGNWIENKINKK